MSRIALILLIVILAILGFFLIKQSRESEETLETDEQAAIPGDDFDFHNWHEFSAPNGSFKVLLPSLPQHATENISDPKFQKKKKYDMYVSEKPDGTVFMINLIGLPDIPPSIDSKKLLTATMNDMVSSNPENKLKTVEVGEYNGYPSLDFIMENNEVNIDAKIFLVENTLYVLSRVVKNQNYTPNEYNFFINSFELSSSPNGS
ncbi:MAG: hypothetical protein WB791_11545 [Waddliaceae bacterium]